MPDRPKRLTGGPPAGRVAPMLTVLGIVLSGYALILALLFALQRSLLYYPSAERPDPAEFGLAGVVTPVALETGDGLTILAWHRPPARDSLPTLVYFHGNAGHIGHRAGKAAVFLEAGLGILLVEYRGYGGNPGRPTEEGLYEDARAAVGFLRERGVAEQRMLLYGESIGAGVAVQIASEGLAAAGIILEAPPTSIAAVAQSHYPFLPAYWLVIDRFDSIAKIGKVRMPLLILHGERDTIVPVRFGRALLEAAQQPKEGRFFPEAGHNDLYEFGAGEVALDFLQRTLRQP